jgi:hypothetical protein
MATKNIILCNLEKDIEKLESFLDDYQTIKEEITENWEKEKPFFVKDFEETIIERVKNIMEELSALYIEKRKFAEDEQERGQNE